jgi:hypothetical protein
MSSSSSDVQSAPTFVMLYRVVQSDPPTRQDFLSRGALGLTPRHPTAKARRLWTGLSTNRTLAQARQLVSASPWLGEYIVELQVPVDGSFHVELDNGRNGHCTLWGQPDDLMALVVCVYPR